MDFLPKEIENIITDYKKQMEIYEEHQIEIGKLFRIDHYEFNKKAFYIRFDCECCYLGSCYSSIVRIYNRINGYTRKNPSYILIKNASEKTLEKICKIYNIPIDKELSSFDYNDFQHIRRGCETLVDYLKSIKDPRATLIKEIEKKRANIKRYKNYIIGDTIILERLLEQLKSME